VLITPRRAIVLGLVLAVAAIGAGGSPAAKKPPKPTGPPVNPVQPCSYLTAAQVQKAFGGPVTIDPTDRGNKVPNACAYLIGANVFAPTAVVVATNQFPGVLVPPGQDGVAVVEAQRAIESESGYNTIDASIGKTGYIDNSLSTIYVAQSTQFAFSLQYLPANEPSTGGPLTAPARKQLLVLAKSVVARTPKS
jgi:hypothetical protein